jgi:hypothetical protein
VQWRLRVSAASASLVRDVTASSASGGSRCDGFVIALVVG